MNSALKWLPLAMLVALAGCARDDGYYHDRNIDYADARQAAPLVLPEGRSAERYRDAMPVPETAADFRGSAGDFEAPAPQPLGAGQLQREFVESRRVGDDAWLVVGAAPDSVWPQLESFARSRGLEVVASDSSRGVVETRQGRLSVRQGLRAGDSEVRCDQAGRPESACLGALEQYLAARSATASKTASLQAQRLAGGERLHLVQRGDEWAVEVPLDIDRTWAELDYQLKQEFTVEERRELLEGTPTDYSHRIRYLPLSERSVGFWKGLVTSESPREIRLELEREGPDRTLLRAVNLSERGFSAEDRRELLERVASLLR
ncbi:MULTISPECIES: lipoprotein, NlpB [unclassified Halomonas]|uniref:lipoprotein, NlpB n=1 Tax=unclassified Halomonas TaxID=2609666 RepID=UPI002883C2A0|nr:MULTISPECIES: lipoprotein, NlpB [unclassified Halomonas]MDT0501832.1 lipoprotein, NlpB [Halomonas sp. PAR7]MDT0511864.1 lipoprotein, NlpB [Halomonas sp. LES1]MDT0592948.1 lipoprotein, NlpB [Halomonas sp. PAR8]